MWGGGGPFHGMYDDERFGGGGDLPARNGAFTRQFRGFPVSFIDRDDLERGDKIVLPPSALDMLARLNIAFPMVFELESRAGRKTHCGVQEFVAEEGHANLPYWLMQNIAAVEGEMVTIRNATLQKGTYVKLQPQSSDFLQIANPKAVLEATLRNFTCLTKGDTIAIAYNDKTYHIVVLAVAPGDAISIVETDVNVDFAPPADAPEETASNTTQAPAAAPPSVPGWRPQQQQQVDPKQRLAERLAKFKAKPGASPADDDSDSSSEEEAPPKRPVFTGTGYTLAGKKGKSLTFGAGAASASTDATNEEEQEGRKEKREFLAFSGKGRSLRD